MSDNMTVKNGKHVEDCVETPPEVDVEPNGVEIGIKQIREIPMDGIIQLTEDLRSVIPKKKDITDDLKYSNNDMEYYDIPHGLYEVRLANKVTIPDESVGLVFPRSSLNRFGVIMHQTAIWDSGYTGYGTLTVDIKPASLVIPVDVNWFQLMLMDAEDSHSYDGTWQNEE